MDSTLRLHWAVTRGVSAVDMDAMIAQYPSGLREKDVNGKLPLHIAAELNAASDLIILLANKYVHGLSAVDNNNMLPIHYLAKLCDDMSVWQDVVKLYPECIRHKDQDGWLPLHHAARDSSCVAALQFLVARYAGALCMKSSHGSLPLHCAAHNNSNIDVLQYLISQHPEGLLAEGKQGMLPLHYVARSNSSLEVVQLLCKQHPKAIVTKDKAGRSPMHYATRNPSIALACIQYFMDIYPDVTDMADNNGWRCVHYICRFMARPDTALAYLQLPDLSNALTCADMEGWLPLHHAAMGAATLDAVQVLVRLCPQALLHSTHHHKFPHDLAAANSDKQLFLLHLYHALKQGDEQGIALQTCMRVHVLGDSMAGKTSFCRYSLATQMGSRSRNETGGAQTWTKSETSHRDASSSSSRSGVQLSHVVLPTAVTTASPAAMTGNDFYNSLISSFYSTAAPTAAIQPPSNQLQMQYSLFDYSGDLDIHSFLFAQPHSLYMLLLPTYSMNTHTVCSASLQKARLRYWLQRLYSSCHSLYPNGIPLYVVLNSFSSCHRDEQQEMQDALLRELQRCYTVRSIGDKEQPTDFLLLDSVLCCDIQQLSHCQRLLTSIRGNAGGLCSCSKPLGPLQRHCYALCSQLQLRVAMQPEHFLGILHSAIQSFYRQLPALQHLYGGAGMGMGVELQKMLYNHLSHDLMQLMQDSDKLLHLCPDSKEEELLVTSPYILHAQLFGPLYLSLEHMLEGVSKGLLWLDNYTSYSKLQDLAEQAGMELSELCRLLVSLDMAVLVQHRAMLKDNRIKTADIALLDSINHSDGMQLGLGLWIPGMNKHHLDSAELLVQLCCLHQPSASAVTTTPISVLLLARSYILADMPMHREQSNIGLQCLDRRLGCLLRRHLRPLLKGWGLGCDQLVGYANAIYLSFSSMVSSRGIQTCNICIYLHKDEGERNVMASRLALHYQQQTSVQGVLDQRKQIALHAAQLLQCVLSSLSSLGSGCYREYCLHPQQQMECMQGRGEDIQQLQQRWLLGSDVRSDDLKAMLFGVHLLPSSTSISAANMEQVLGSNNSNTRSSDYTSPSTSSTVTSDVTEPQSSEEVSISISVDNKQAEMIEGKDGEDDDDRPIYIHMPVHAPTSNNSSRHLTSSSQQEHEDDDDDGEDAKPSHVVADADQVLSTLYPELLRALLTIDGRHDNDANTAEACKTKKRLQLQSLLLYMLHQQCKRSIPASRGVDGPCLMEVSRRELRCSAEKLLQLHEEQLQQLSLLPLSPMLALAQLPMLLPLLQMQRPCIASAEQQQPALRCYELRFLCHVCAQPSSRYHLLHMLDDASTVCSPALLRACNHTVMVLEALLLSRGSERSVQLLQLAGGAQETLELLLEQADKQQQQDMPCLLSKERLQKTQSLLFRSLQQRLLQPSMQQSAAEAMPSAMPVGYSPPVLLHPSHAQQEIQLELQRFCAMLGRMDAALLSHVTTVEGKPAWICSQAGSEGQPSSCQGLLDRKGVGCLLVKMQL